MSSTNHEVVHHDDDVSSLRKANAELFTQNKELQLELLELKEQLTALRRELEGRAVGCEEGASNLDHGIEATGQPPTQTPSVSLWHQTPPRAPARHGLSRAQVERYSRHLLLPVFGVAAQERLCRGSVLVVGCGGLGSPVAMYLAAAGVGRLGLVDHDDVDVTNLHRQVMHATGRVGLPKALSGRLTCTALNPTIQVDAHVCGFLPTNALQLTDEYDVVVDASDNPATRYLVSDACVVSGKPLVSAAAVGADGQLTVYHYGQDGPCYRCLFPESPAPENCSRCGEAGVLGVVPGVMGCLQALEAIKILSGVGDVSSKKMTIFDGLAGRFTTVRLRGRNPACVACGSEPSITRATLPSYDYVMFTGQPPDDGPAEELKLVDPRLRLPPADVARMLVWASMTAAAAATSGADEAGGTLELAAAGQGVANAGECAGSDDGDAAADPLKGSSRPVFLDVRPQTQYDVMALPGVVHLPYEHLEARLPEVLALCGGVSSVSSSRAEAAAAAAGRAGGDATDAVDATTTATGTAIATPATAANTVATSDEVVPGTGAGGSGDCGVRGEGSGVGRPAPPRVVVLCRRGNNSQRAVARLAALGLEGITDMRGGYQAWAREVDPDMPLL